MTTHAPKAPAAPGTAAAAAAPAAPTTSVAGAAPAAPEAPAEKPAKAEKAPKTPKEPKAPKVEREKQNGQTKPGEGTLTRKLWDAIDKISADSKQPATRKEVMEAAAAGGFNTAMAASLYSHWRKFHGLTGANAPGRTTKPEDDAPKGDAPAAPKA